MNWKSYVEKKNAKTYVLPAGWDSRETIAEQLECNPEKVRDHLRPAIQSKEVLEQRFNVWDAGLKRCIMVTAYKEAEQESPSSEFDAAKAVAMKNAGKTYAEIGANIGLSGDAVRAKLRRVKSA